MLLGYSTGAAAFGDFCRGISLINPLDLEAIELSALREAELEPLINALDQLALSQYRYVSLHAPSRFAEVAEARIVELLKSVAQRGWPIIVHPDSIHTTRLWKTLGSNLCFENMDKRKPIGRTADEVAGLFERFPDACLCMDLGHAWQVDRTMSEASQIVRRFRDRIRQIHVSEVNTHSQHTRLTLSTVTAFRKVVDLLPSDVPWIIESVLTTSEEITAEVQYVREAFARAETNIAD